MKYKNAIIITCLVSLIASCATTQKVTLEKRPTATVAVGLSSIVPGLPQLLNKEYKKCAIVAGTFIASVAGIVISNGKQTPPIDDTAQFETAWDFLFYGSGLLSVGTLFFSAIDGLNDSSILNNQYDKLIAQRKAERLRAERVPKKYYDKYTRVTSINNFFFADEPLRISIAKHDDSPAWSIFLTAEYRGDDWIFFDRVIVVNKDGDRIEYNTTHFDKATETTDSGVFERAVFRASTTIDKLLAVLNGNEASIALIGKDRYTFSVDSYYIERLNAIYAEYANPPSGGIGSTMETIEL